MFDTKETITMLRVMEFQAAIELVKKTVEAHNVIEARAALNSFCVDDNPDEFEVANKATGELLEALTGRKPTENELEQVVGKCCIASWRLK